MIRTAIGGSSAILDKQLSGAKYAGLIANVGGASKTLGDIKKKEFGRSRKNYAEQTLSALGITLLDANRQKIRDC